MQLADLDLDLDALRQRRSAKWRAYPPDVLPAWVAEMDFQLAAPITAALQQAVASGDCGYAAPDELPAALARFVQERFGWVIEPADVFAVPDVMVGVAEAIRLLTAPGDGVVINPPVYAPFFSTVRDVERRVVEAPLALVDGRWELDLDALGRTFATEGARAYLLCSPHNPTGRVFAAEELREVARLAAEHDVAVISDEIHAPLALPGVEHAPFTTVSPQAADAVVVTSASKAWNIPGLKCAALVAGSAAMRDRLAKGLPTDFRYRSGHFGVLASLAAYREGAPWLDAVRRRIAGNHELLAGLLDENLPQVRRTPPQASYLAWLDCRALDLGDDPAKGFLQRGRVALSPGPTFGQEGRGFARLNVATSPVLLTEAVRRMARAVAR